MRGPVQGAQKGAGRDGVADERADAALVPIAFGDDGAPKARRQGVDLEVRRGAFDLVEQAQDVGDREVVEPRAEGAARTARARQRRQQPVQRPRLAEEEQLVLAAEVVVQIAGGERGGPRDVAHARRRETHLAERARGGPEDLDPPGIGALHDAG